MSFFYYFIFIFTFSNNVFSNIWLIESGLKCYYCGHEDSDECSGDITGEQVSCQMNDPEKPHYGNNCYVGHLGNAILVNVLFIRT